MVRLEQTLAPLLVIAVCSFQPFCEAAVESLTYTPKHSNQCIYQQTNAVETLVKCVYSNTNLAKCKKSFTRVWRKLTRSKQGSAPFCFKEYPPAQSVLSVVTACTQAYFKEHKCHELTEKCFLALAHDKDKAVCKDDKKRCPDGSYVTRDPAKNCEFSDCPKGCKNDKKMCPDGTYVKRDPDDKCNFEPCCCPADDYKYCLIGTAECCPNGEWKCPNGKTYHCDNMPFYGTFSEKCGCSGEKKQCPDGSYISPDPDNYCKYPECPKGCRDDKYRCPDGTYVRRDPDDDCNFEPCCCPAETFPYCFIGTAECCPDGDWSCPSRDVYFCDRKPFHGPFGEVCPIKDCRKDYKMCADGSYVYRNPNDDCNFDPCCCQADDKPFCGGGRDTKCCAGNGEWACSDYKYPEYYKCEDKWTKVGPFGEECRKCCNPYKEPGQFGNPFCFEGHQCCPDGTWSCSIGDGKTFPCGGKTITKGFGQKCPKRPRL